MNDIQYIIHCWLDVEKFLGVATQPFMLNVRNANWTKERIRLFNIYTLPSLLNQRFQDFRIFLFCGNTHRAIHERLITHPRVEKIYDFGQEKYLNHIKTPYINIMRIDSDDMFRDDLMEEVVDRTQKNPEFRTCLVFKKVMQWNIHHQFISDYRLPRSPFCSHTFPKSIYKNWQKFSVQQFMDYKSCERRGSEKKVCIVRHTNNVTWPRIGKNPKENKYLLEEKSKRNNFTANRDMMLKVLKRFGVKKEMLFR